MKWQLPFVSRSRYAALDEEFAARKAELVDTVIVNGSLTDDLADARERLAEYEGGRRTVPEVLEEYDGHRKALAEALSVGTHLSWDQLIQAALHTYQGALDCKADYEAEKRRADRFASYLDDGDRKAIKQWEQRVKAHDAWTPPTSRDAIEARPTDGGSGRPTHPAVELRRAQQRCRELEARLTVAEGRKRVTS